MGKKILLADDSVTIQKVVELTLADEDYDLTMVSDGASALQKADEIKPDLILADIVMPELNGYELCGKIHQQPSLSHVPVILLCSTFETFDQDRGTLVGADDHIIKPFESEELTRKIRACLEKKREPVKEALLSQTKDEAVPSLESGMKAGAPGPEKVEEEEFEFELTDEFMTGTEEALDNRQEVSASGFTPHEETDEALPDELPGFEETALMDSSVTPGEKTAEELITETFEQTVPEEISPESLENISETAETKTTDDLRTPSEEKYPMYDELSTSSETQEIDEELVDEEEVNLYEIPEEYAEGPDLLKLEEVREEKPFRVETHAVDLDAFMAEEESAGTSSSSEEPQTDLSDDEIIRAVEEERETSSVKPIEGKPAAAAFSEDAGESFEDVFPTRGATTSEWSPELTTFGGEPEAISKEVVEKPLQDRVASGPAPSLDEETVRRILADMVNKMASEIIERIAWDVIPDLAEVLIKKEIQRLQQEVEPR